MASPVSDSDETAVPTDSGPSERISKRPSRSSGSGEGEGGSDDSSSKQRSRRSSGDAGGDHGDRDDSPTSSLAGTTSTNVEPEPAAPTTPPPGTAGSPLAGPPNPTQPVAFTSTPQAPQIALQTTSGEDEPDTGQGDDDGADAPDLREGAGTSSLAGTTSGDRTVAPTSSLAGTTDANRPDSPTSSLAGTVSPAFDRGGTPSEGPAIGDGDEIDPLADPGSITVTCSTSAAGKGSCDPTKPAPTAAEKRGKAIDAVTKGKGKTSGDFEVAYSMTNGRESSELGEDGRRMTSVSVASDLRGTGSVTREGLWGSGTLAGFAGHGRTYAANLRSENVDAITEGQRRPPDPGDPRSLEPGESVTLSEEDYKGGSASGKALRLLKAGLTLSEGERVSSGIQRIDRDTARIYVGDEDVVKPSVEAGLSIEDQVELAAVNSTERAKGRLRQLDINIADGPGSTYRRFLGGQLGQMGDEDVEDEAIVDRSSNSSKTGGRVKLGPVSVELPGSDREETEAHTRHVDGTVDYDYSARHDTYSWTQHGGRNADGTARPNRHGIQMKDVEPGAAAMLADLDGGPRDRSFDDTQDITVEFSDADLMGLRDLAWAGIAAQSTRQGRPLTTADVREAYADGESYRLPVTDHTTGRVAGAQTPTAVLDALAMRSGGSATEGAGNLSKLALGQHIRNVFDGDLPGHVTVRGHRDSP